MLERGFLAVGSKRPARSCNLKEPSVGCHSCKLAVKLNADGENSKRSGSQVFFFITTALPYVIECHPIFNPIHRCLAIGHFQMISIYKPYNTRIQKGGALLDDMRMLVRSWEEGTAGTGTEVRHLLGKKTLVRSRDTMVRAFTPRFLQGDPPNAWKVVRLLEDRDAAPEILRPVYYWITARSDRLLYEFVTKELIYIVASGDGSVRIEETAGWISRQIKKTGQEWSPTVTLKVARGMLAALRDFGVLEGGSKKRVAPAHLPMEAFCYIAFWLGQLGHSGENLVGHADWGLFLFRHKNVERLMLEAHQQGLVSFHSAGRIYRVDFPTDDPGDYADVLFGRKPQEA